MDLTVCVVEYLWLIKCHVLFFTYLQWSDVHKQSKNNFNFVFMSNEDFDNIVYNIVHNKTKNSYTL